MRRDHNVVEHSVDKKVILEKIDLLMENLINIKDSGEFLLHFDEIVVDDKSWNVWHWPQGIGLFGIYKYYQATKSQKAKQIVENWFDQQFEIGLPAKNINTMAPLLTLSLMYEETKDSKLLPYLEKWANWAMYELPRTKEAGFMHLTFGSFNEEQLWDDTLMMAVLPLAKIGKILGKMEYIEEAKRQFMLHAKYLQDRKTGLWFHGWTFKGNHNFAEALWARGNCWITIAIPELIEILDLHKDDGFRLFLEETLKQQVNALINFQKESGLWPTLLNESESYIESSATAGFAYGILKAIRKGYIENQNMENVENAIVAIVNQIDENGELQNVSVGTPMGEDLEFYRMIPKTAMPYGQSLAVLALTEYLYTFI